MMIKYKNNLLFIITFIVVCTIIISLNTIKDPYGIRHFQKQSALSAIFPRDKINIFLKATKDNKYDKLLIGGSNSASMWNIDIFQRNNIAVISINMLTYKQIYELLETWLRLHPETKTFLFPLEHLVYLENNENNLPAFKEESYNLQDLYFLFFSYETTKRSIEYPPFWNRQYTSKSFQVNPKRKQEIPYKILDKNQRYIYLQKIIQLLNEKNIKVICFIPPYHAWYLSQIYKHPIYNEIKDLMRYIVSQNINIYNFATINKYTKKSLLNDNFLYIDIWHPTEVFGGLVFSAILNSPTKYNIELYDYIDKYNIETMLKYNEEKIENFIKTNKKDYNTFLSFTYGPNFDDWYYSENRTKKYISEFEE